MSTPKRILTVSVIDDGESCRLTVCQEDLIGQTLVAVFGQSRDGRSGVNLPSNSAEVPLNDSRIPDTARMNASPVSESAASFLSFS